MRTIKFRAWHETAKQMIYSCPVEWRAEKLVCLSYTTEGEETTLPIMQYTGLKDKNGVEIYEGDILKSNDTIYPVVWSQDKFGFEIAGKPKGFTHYQAFSFSSQIKRTAEIIGNIHQNSELLTP